jgi:multicomponent Na+:H+ antiporter subunit G
MSDAAALTPWDFYTLTLVALGALFFLAGTLGLLRFPDTLTRLHALTKADNLGLGLVVLGLLPQVPWPTGLKLLAVWLLALFAGATVGQLLGGAVRQNLPPDPDPLPGGRVADERPFAIGRVADERPFAIGRVADERPFAIGEEDLGRDRRGGHP